MKLVVAVLNLNEGIDLPRLMVEGFGDFVFLQYCLPLFVLR